MKKLFISSQIPDTVSSIFKDMGFSLVLLPPEPSLPEPVSAHGDMLMFENIVQKDYYERNRALFDGFDIVLADEGFGNKYPRDILLNAFTVGDTLFGRLDSLASQIKIRYPNAVNLRQGYAKCSTLLFGNNAVTADTGIADALSDFGCEVLLIRQGSILLPGYDYGFIGGASFVYDKRVVFFGNIEAHPDHIRIREFIEARGYDILYDPRTPLVDLGGAVMIKG